MKEKTSNWLTDLPQIKGMYACGHCKICRYVDRSAVFTDADHNVEFQIKNFINCSATRVIYMLECPCRKYYIGKTKQQLRARISEHIRSIGEANREDRGMKKKELTPLAIHFAELHGG